MPYFDATIHDLLRQANVAETLAMNELCIFSCCLLQRIKGIMLAQLVQASVGPAEVRRFEPHLGQTMAISLSGWLGGYTNVEYLQSLYLKRRGQLLSEWVMTRLYRDLPSGLMTTENFLP